MNIYITLDYELFLNDITGDVDHCLIIPTKELLKVLEKHQVKATFFVDMAYLYRVNELRSLYANLQEDYKKVVAQVKELSSCGQSIGLHLHPQWFYSDFNGKEWIIDFNHYKLSDMEPSLAKERFISCYNTLCEITNTRIDSFRAGGYSIQGYNEFIEIIDSLGICKDSSVLYKEKNLSPLHYYDYTGLNNSDVFCFQDSVTTPTPSGQFKEYPISTTTVGYLNYCRNRFKMMTLKNNNNWGNGGDLPGKHTSSFIKKIFKGIGSSMRVCATLDYQSFLYCNKVYSDYRRDQKKDLVMIGHPKNFSSESLGMLDDFIGRTKENNIYATI